MANEANDQTEPTEPQSLSPEQRLWQIHQNMPEVNLVQGLLGGEADPELVQTTAVNFELGKEAYHRVKEGTKVGRRVGVDIAKGGNLEEERRKIESNMNSWATRLNGPEGYLERVRAYRLGAERDLWNMNIARKRMNSQMRSETADRDAQQVRNLHRNLSNASAQLNGAACAALEDNDLVMALLFCEAAGDFLPEGKTVIKPNPNLIKKDDTLKLVLDFVEGKGDDLMVETAFKDTMDAIKARLEKEQRIVTGFETKTLPGFGEPGDAMFSP